MSVAKAGKPIFERIRIALLNQRFTLADLWRLRSSFLGVLSSRRKLANLLSSYVSVRLRLRRVLGVPPYLMIEVSSRCNLRCLMCPRQSAAAGRQEGDMGYADFKALIDEIGDSLTMVLLWDFGEPLMNPDLAKMIGYAKTKNIIVMVSTNGTLLGPDKADQILRSGLDYLVVSIDGATRSTYERYRVGADFDRTLHNLRDLVRRRDEMRLALPFVDVHFLVMRETETELATARDLFADLGVDKVSLKSLDFCNEEQIARHQPADRRLRRDRTSHGATFCRRPFMSSVVCWNGDVHACCRDIGFSHKLGNAFQEGGFRRVWNNAAYAAFRGAMAVDRSQVDICKSCYNVDFDRNTFL